MINTNADNLKKVTAIIDTASNAIEAILGCKCSLVLKLKTSTANSTNINNEKTDFIIDTICEYYNYDRKEVCSNSRTSKYAEARFIAYKLIYDNIQPTPSLKNIGLSFSRRDHTTIIHGLKQFERLFTTDPDFKQEFTDINNIVQSEFLKNITHL